LQPLYELDRAIFQAVHGWRSDWLDPAFATLADAGLGHVQAAGLLAVAAWRGWPGAKGRGAAALLALVVLLAAFLQGDLLFHTTALALSLLVFAPLAVREALTIAAVAAIAGAVRLVIVEWADRLRPSNYAFADPLEHVYGYTSFPSGHATTAFAIAFATMFFVWRTGRAWVGWLALAYACGIGLSRLYVGVHFPTDVIAAAGLALACVSLWWLGVELPRAGRSQSKD
jgi:membrane-associated phospholipid phosphatase